MDTQRSSHSIDMLSAPLLKSIMLFALPVAASSILQQLFNSADTAIAGRFGTPEALAAVGTNGEIVALIVSLSAGLAVGANVLIARLIGSGRHQHIPDAVHTAMLFSVVIGVLLGIAGQFVSEPLLMLINTPENIIGQAAEYLRIYFAGVPFLMIYDFGSAVLRSKGDSRRPLAALIISGVINLLLNLLFVIVFRIDVIGVALATDISTAISALMVTYWLMREQGEFRLSLRSLRLEKDCLRKIVAIGIPAALQGAVFCIANIFIQSAINTFGSDAAAGSAIAMNFEYLAYYVNTAFGQAATTFTSQNYAAGNIKRCRSIFAVCLVLATAFSAVMCLSLTALRYQASGLFTRSQAEIEYACERILIILCLQPICSLYEIPAWTMRGLGTH